MCHDCQKLNDRGTRGFKRIVFSAEWKEKATGSFCITNELQTRVFGVNILAIDSAEVKTAFLWKLARIISEEAN